MSPPLTTGGGGDGHSAGFTKFPPVGGLAREGGYGSADNMAPLGKRARIVLSTQELVSMFPLMFTLVVSLLYVIPIWILYNTGQDPEVMRWITTKLWVVLILPALYAITHAVHFCSSGPNRILVTLCLVGSGMLLFCLSELVLLRAYSAGIAFVSKDCDTFAGKKELEDSWKAAQAFYSDCTSASPATAAPLLISNCTGYGTSLEANPDWAYLARLENEHRCSGWCTRSPPMWTMAAVKDSCSTVLGDIMLGGVQPSMVQITIHSILCLGLSAVLLLVVPPILRSHGCDW